jgi:hypothetical protein
LYQIVACPRPELLPPKMQENTGSVCTHGFELGPHVVEPVQVARQHTVPVVLSMVAAANGYGPSGMMTGASQQSLLGTAHARPRHVSRGALSATASAPHLSTRTPLSSARAQTKRARRWAHTVYGGHTRAARASATTVRSTRRGRRWCGRDRRSLRHCWRLGRSRGWCRRERGAECEVGCGRGVRMEDVAAAEGGLIAGEEVAEGGLGAA